MRKTIMLGALALAGVVTAAGCAPIEETSEAKPSKTYRITADQVVSVMGIGKREQRDFCAGIDALGVDMAFASFRNGWDEGSLKTLAPSPDMKVIYPKPRQVFAKILARC